MYVPYEKTGSLVVCLSWFCRPATASSVLTRADISQRESPAPCKCPICRHMWLEASVPQTVVAWENTRRQGEVPNQIKRCL